MRILRGLLLAGALAWLLAPELPRYRAERMLRSATGALRYLVSHPTEISDPRGLLARLEQVALSAAPGLPGDSRPLVLAGSCRLVGADTAGALDEYRKAIALGERAEIDLNLGRAYEAGGEAEKAAASFLRALWISPALSAALLPDVKSRAQEQYRSLEGDLRAGRLKQPPPLPR